MSVGRLGGMSAALTRAQRTEPATENEGQAGRKACAAHPASLASPARVGIRASDPCTALAPLILDPCIPRPLARLFMLGIPVTAGIFLFPAIFYLRFSK